MPETSGNDFVCRSKATVVILPVIGTTGPFARTGRRRSMLPLGTSRHSMQ
jgi:hypothetical protein